MDTLAGFHSRLKSKSRFYWSVRENYTGLMIWLKGLFSLGYAKTKPRILFYNIAGLGYGGTEAFLQILAKHLNKQKYDVYFMYGDKKVEGSGIEDFQSRLQYILEGQVFPIRFDYSSVQSGPPYFVEKMSPNIFKILQDLKIDLFVTSGSGHPSFPFRGVKNIPIIFLNIFGQPNLQKNITYHLCISEQVAKNIRPFVAKDKVKVMYVPSENPLPGSADRGLKLRRSLGIPDSDLVFGRVGRSTDGIFDPIGIQAFKQTVVKYPFIHYLIVSPAPALREIVKNENIPNVHFVPGSGKLEDLWAFFYAMDILAHFRKDGESFGLNIAQAMLCRRPVVSHKSRQWNAHLEYLTDDFSRVAEVDNVTQYAGYMQWFIIQWKNGSLKQLGQAAQKKAQELVSIERHSKDFEFFVEQSLKSHKND